MAGAGYRELRSPEVVLGSLRFVDALVVAAAAVAAYWARHGHCRIAVDAEAETVVNGEAELGVGVTFDGGLLDACCLVCRGLATSFNGAADGCQRVLEKA